MTLSHLVLVVLQADPLTIQTLVLLRLFDNTLYRDRSISLL